MGFNNTILKSRSPASDNCKMPTNDKTLSQDVLSCIKRSNYTKCVERRRNLLDKECSARLPKSSALIRLLPFIDSKGLLRVRGRLHNASLDCITKQPYIIPKNSPLTTLIIQKAHKETLHGSTQDTLNYIRNKFWILGGRAPVRSFILKCVVCTRYRRSLAKQIMGQLPASRVTPSRAFLHSGVDYAGPFTLKTWKDRAARTYKSWIAVFVCYSTTAIHLEIVTDYTTDAFLAAYKSSNEKEDIDQDHLVSENEQGKDAPCAALDLPRGTAGLVPQAPGGRGAPDPRK
ncbi:uncharacterized protein LOC117169808 [Belonocnema kinseyi]|uniref:uncharacterized protein LOC117169808 n=1 Tax=Belonocnema kinseyi TaxID=2817044 RepID=UPI00143DFEDE|nr:uncharacterized protein LOC117169808 [Belonocnema kinseyi]